MNEPISPKRSIEITPAAAYLRMSTDHQKYSTMNQLDEIREYAEAHNMEIIRIYSDEGISGLRIKGREALQQLIEDVKSRNTNFKDILVYDVSRWGRFQDIDESAYYEYICRSAGFNIVYCAEQFENDGTPVATLVKSMKRLMAAEYSRDLSKKVKRGQRKSLQMGYWPGGNPGYGLRRMLVDDDGTPIAVLERGQRKTLQSYRIKIVPGPKHEVKTVRYIFSSFVEKKMPKGEIIFALNNKKKYDPDRPMNRNILNHVLRNELFIGNCVYGRTSKSVFCDELNKCPEEWIRIEGFIKPIIKPSLFNEAQILLQQKKFHHLSDNELLSMLKRKYTSNGTLTKKMIDKDPNIPCAGLYSKRFGNLANAYDLIGYVDHRDFHYQGKGYTDEELLGWLRVVLKKNGKLSMKIIDNSEDCPSITIYLNRFGKISEAYRLIGFKLQPHNRFSKKELLNMLRTVLEKEGKLSTKIINESKDCPDVTVYYRRFKSISTAYRCVNFVPEPQRHFHNEKKDLTDEAMLEKVMAIWKREGRLSASVIDKHDDSPSAYQYRCRFGSLPHLYELIGYKPKEQLSHGFLYSDDYLLKKLKAVYKKHGKLNMRIVNEEKDCPNFVTFIYRFGTISRAYELIGYEQKQGYSDEYMLSKLRKIYEKEGRLSKAVMAKYDDCPSPTTYAKHFGDMATAYKLVGYEQIRSFSKEYMLEKLMAVYRKEKKLTKSVISKYPDCPSSTTLQKYFGTYTKAFELVEYLVELQAQAKQ